MTVMRPLTRSLVVDKQLPSHRSTGWILRGTFIAAFSLSVLLICYNVAVYSSLDGHHFTIPIVGGTYLLLTWQFFKAKRYNIVNWMLILFYGTLAFAILFEWGLNTPVGLLAMCFTVILPSILVSPKLVLPVAIMANITLVAIQLIHPAAPSVFGPRNDTASSTFWDVFVYSAILGIFAVVSWVSGNQREKTLQRALAAEKTLAAQRDMLRDELDKESAVLRQTQLKQIRELHTFALIGQSAAATLHDLSSHLSVLNLDIDDLRQQHAHSRAVANAKDSIQHINKMVRQARRQLNSYGQRETFDARAVIQRSIKDMQEKFNRRNVVLEHELGAPSTYPISGSPAALMQMITILLNNALDACSTSLHPKVIVSLKRNTKHLVISVDDNGPGIAPSEQQSLFTPVVSSKPSGMGVGLYIAHHLAKNHFNGSLSLKPKRHGARFIITVPYA